MAPSTFAERFGFARWLRHLETGEPPSFAEIGRAVERTGQAVSAWSTAAEAPTDWRLHDPLAAFLGVADGWLVKNVGDPPREDLWRVWVSARRGISRPVQRATGAIAPSTPQANEADIIARGGGGSFTPRKSLEELQRTKKPAAKKASRRRAGGEGKAG